MIGRLQNLQLFWNYDDSVRFETLKNNINNIV